MKEEPILHHVLAWDVGIRNLAGCLLEWNAATEQWKPLWWDVLDLRECEAGISCCGQQRISGALVPCKAMPDWEYTQPATGHRMTACSRHKRLLVQAQNKAPVIPDPIEMAANPDHHCVTCGKKARWRFEQELYCAIHAKKAKKDREKACALNRIGEKATGQKGTDQWKERLWRKLDSMDFWLRAEEVFIENQPALRNPTMKSIAETLYCFFMCRGVIDKEVTGSSIERVRFIAPISKQSGSGFEKSEEAKENDRTRYKEAKKFSITTAREMIREKCPASLRHLEEHPKKDDLCDALLLALEGMQRRKKGAISQDSPPSSD